MIVIDPEVVARVLKIVVDMDDPAFTIDMLAVRKTARYFQLMHAPNEVDDTVPIHADDCYYLYYAFKLDIGEGPIEL